MTIVSLLADLWSERFACVEQQVHTVVACNKHCGGVDVHGHACDIAMH